MLSPRPSAYWLLQLFPLLDKSFEVFPLLYSGLYTLCYLYADLRNHCQSQTLEALFLGILSSLRTMTAAGVKVKSLVLPGVTFGCGLTCGSQLR